jgi:ArsR family transcriptional regulator
MLTEDVKGFLNNDAVVYGATQIFDALSDFTRFQILSALLGGDKSVSELQELCHVSQSAISHQLRLLRDRGLVTPRREGQRKMYMLSDNHVELLIGIGLEHAAESEGEER